MSTPFRWPQAALFLPLMAALLAGCSKVVEEEELLPEASFSFDFPAIPVTLDSAVVASPSGLALALDSSALAQAMQVQGYLPGQLLGISLDKATLYVSSPVNGNYDGVQTITLKLGAGESAPVTVAAMDPVPDGAQTLLLPMLGAEVLSVLQGPQPRVSFRMAFDGPVVPQSSHLLVLGARVKVRI